MLHNINISRKIDRKVENKNVTLETSSNRFFSEKKKQSSLCN